MRNSGWFLLLSAVIFAGALFTVSACQSAPPPPAAKPAPETPAYQPTATIKDIMMSIVDPNADVVWLSVTTVQSAKGTVDTAPRNDEEWKNVRKGAVALSEAANLLMMPGRHVANAGEKSETPGVELEPSEMEALVNQDRAAWNMRVKALRDVSVEVLKAVDARDPKAVFEVGDRLDQACENCHKQYWYPNEQIPVFPSDLDEKAGAPGAGAP